MDDCDLEKLSAAPAKLSPKFNRNTTEYESTVPSSVEKVKVDCLTSDSGASYQVFGGGGEKNIPLIEGSITEIRIEVSAEDGTTKNYILRIKRLSASDATLSSLALTGGKLDPAFSTTCYDYTCTVPCNMGDIPVKATAPDKKCVIVIANAHDDCVVPLFLGETTLTISVTSVDGKNIKDYKVVVTRKQLPWYVVLKDVEKAKSFECPMTLSPLYNPISIAGSDPKVSMSQPVIDMLTRRSKINPMNEMNLEKDWRVVDGKLDKEISDFVAFSVYKYKGVSGELPLRKMADHVNSCEGKPRSEVDTAIVLESSWYKAEFEGSSSATKTLQHKVEVRNWEKRLQHMASESNVDALLKDADKRQKQYKQKLPLKPGETLRFSEGESPTDDLQQVCVSLAAAIKGKSKEAKLHLRLAYALEEIHYLKEMFGLQKKDGDTEEHGAGTNIAAQESSKLEECQAICRLRGVSATAPIALQLKAIDEEYRSLRDGGQSSRADHVQALYAWRSKQALKGEQSSARHTDENEPLAQAYLKYMDALACDANNYLCNLHVGRMLVDREDYKEAVVRLQQAVGLKPVSVEARFLLGVALCLQEGGAGSRITEALTYLHDGLDHMLMRSQKDAETAGLTPSSITDLHAEDFWRQCNAQLLQYLYMLACNVRKSPQPNMRSAKEIYHCVCLHASMALCSLFHRGPMFQQIEWLLLDAQYALLELMMENQPNDIEWIAQRCRYLSAMIRTSTIPKDSKLLTLQEKVR
uniref:Uncharacterized protein LOC104266112 n=1 Tax=Phallusia mammillata TaxID=59560 RepID=A0A6F9DJ82_9ASCI|nr:uncharacterized protein LOC104266112 [Phallusia mammillata]